MKTPFTNHLMLASAVLALAACSSAQSQEVELHGAPNTAVTVQSFDTADLQPAFPQDVPPPLNVPEPIVPEAVVPETLAPVPAAPKNVAPPRPAVQSARADATCEILVVRTSNGVRITPVVRAHGSTHGEYSLVVTKTGASGSSDISQGGPFDAVRGERVKLSASEFSLERGARFRAVLTITEDGRQICRDVRS
jgi:hypothetical protein